MNKHLVLCRYCGERFDANSLKKGEDWVMPSRNRYFHTACYQKFRDTSNKKGTKKEIDEEWHELIYDFVKHDLKRSYNYHLCEAQLKNYVEKDKIGTYKGIFFALKYFYEVKENEWEKGNGGIGIIPYIYQESVQYWMKIEEKKKGTIAAIEQQIRERTNQQTITHKRVAPKEKKKGKWNLEDIE